MGLISVLMKDPAIFIALVVTLIFSLVLHEIAHGYVAYKCGDMTAYHQGRLTLNPLAHLDPIGSLMILFIGFGWAKPVPVNMLNLKNPDKDMVKVAMAGPATNFLLSILCLFIWKLMLVMSMDISPGIITFFSIFMYINLALCIFNLLPIPPLDGSRLLSYEVQYKFQRYGPIFLFGLIILGNVSNLNVIGSIMDFLINPFIDVFEAFLKL